LTDISDHNLAAPPPPPRPITKSARRRSWAEPNVRSWLLMAALLFIIGLWWVGVRVYASWKDYSLIKNGIRVDAEILDVMGNPLHKQYSPDLNYRFHMTWRMPDGKTLTVDEPLKAQRAALGPGMKVPLYVDPKNPNHWTDRQEISWSEDTLVGICLLPIMLLLIGFAIFNRFKILQAWKNGHAIHGTIVEVKQSAAAPRSRVVRMVLSNYHDQRIFTTLVPTSRANYQQGDVVWLIIPNTTPRWAILAELYE
jgi:uncharacterized protein DUF3592